ncbi:hypothetical protein APASM_0582 [Actinosynnema pretiosum subsp. pretiosum]|nr:hypothetical protein APASM_0582 [Actinosynnema pretiosum subsp. pretiosum]
MLSVADQLGVITGSGYLEVRALLGHRPSRGGGGGAVGAPARWHRVRRRVRVRGAGCWEGPG